MTTRPALAALAALADLATLAGAMPIGEHFLFTLDELARLVRLAGGASELIALHDRCEKAGVSVKLYVDSFQ